MLAFIEALEPRIAPASLLGNVLTYTDTDGDEVTISFVTEGKMRRQAFVFDTPTFEDDGPQHLKRILLSPDGEFRGLIMSATASGSGDGEVDVGKITARGTDLGAISIAGDLGGIVAGDDNLQTQALGTLEVASLGGDAFRDEFRNGKVRSQLEGGLGELLLHGDLDQARLRVRGSLGNIEIAGSLIGGAAADSGLLLVAGSIDFVTIKGDLVGGAGAYSGGIYCRGTIGNLSLQGDMLGGDGTFSANIEALRHITSASVQGDVQGGAGNYSGKIACRGNFDSLWVGGSLQGGSGIVAGLIAGGYLGRVTVEGNVVGGNGYQSAQIYTDGDAGTIEVRGDVRGGDHEQSGNLTVFGTLNSARIGGDLVGGFAENAGGIFAGRGVDRISIGRSVITGSGMFSAQISASWIGSVVIEGDLLGTAESRAVISAYGKVQRDALTLQNVEIYGSVAFADILAGADPVGAERGGSIGNVYVSDNWTASSIAAGVVDEGENGFGNADDRPPGSPSSSRSSTIESIIIRGTVSGTTDSQTDHFGFTAQRLGSVTISGVEVPLTPGAGNDRFLPVPGVLTGDVTLNEVVDVAPAPADQKFSPSPVPRRH